MRGNPHAGVFRFRRLVGGRPAWYATDERGEIADFRVIGETDSEVAVVAELAERVFGATVRAPYLRLMSPSPAAASWSPALFARIHRARPLSQHGGPRPA